MKDALKRVIATLLALAGTGPATAQHYFQECSMSGYSVIPEDGAFADMRVSLDKNCGAAASGHGAGRWCRFSGGVRMVLDGKVYRLPGLTLTCAAAAPPCDCASAPVSGQSG